MSRLDQLLLPLLAASLVAACGRAAPRLVAPLSTANVTTRRPTLHWALADGTDGAHVEICGDRACTRVLATFDATGSSGAPTADLPPGIAFWRVRGREGSDTGSATSATWEFNVPSRSAAHDASWGSTLDVNGDGFADVIVAATYGYMPSELGLVTGPADLYLGSANGLAAAASRSLSGTIIDQFRSQVIAPVGDVNGDGFADVIVARRLYLGSAEGLAASATTEGVQFYGVLASAGDVNGDGFGDVISGGAGRALVYLGGATGLSATPSFSLASPYGDGNFGAAVAGAGDVDGDGFDDVIVGASSSAYLFLGSRNGFAALPVLVAPGDSSQTGFGSAIDVADVNGDGHTDVLFGTVGYVFTYLGGAGGLATSPGSPLASPEGADAVFGVDVANAGDVNGDGFSDVIAGSHGGSYLCFGSAEGLSTIRTMPSNSPLSTGIGDVNGDGFADVAGGNEQGAYVVLGSAMGLSSTPIPIAWTPPAGFSGLPFFGATIASDDASAGLGDRSQPPRLQEPSRATAAMHVGNSPRVDRLRSHRSFQTSANRTGNAVSANRRAVGT